MGQDNNPQQPPFGQPAQPPYGPQGQPPYGPQGQPPYGPPPYGPPAQPVYRPPAGPVYGGGQAPPPQPPKRGKGGTIILAVGVGLGLVGLGLIGVQTFLRPQGSTVTASSPPTAATSSGPVTTTSAPVTASATAAPAPLASDAVKGYLDALTAGDAATALAYAETPPNEAAFLTDKVLAAVNALAPINSVRVTPSEPGATSVQASYRIGNRDVSATFDMVDTPAGFRLRTVADPVSLASVRSPGIPLRLAGQVVRSDTVLLFPGAYKATTGLKYLGYTRADLLVTAPGVMTVASGMDPVITKAGKSAFIKAAKSAWAACLKVDSVAPKGCAFGVRMPAGVKLRTKTITWRTVSGAKFDSIKPALVADTPTLAEAAMKARVRFDGTATDGSRWYGYGEVHGVRADLKASKVKVTFY